MLLLLDLLVICYFTVSTSKKRNIAHSVSQNLFQQLNTFFPPNKTLYSLLVFHGTQFGKH